MKIIKIGTRGSRLAVRQAEIVREAIESLGLPVKAELAVIQTKGDKILDRTLDKIGGKGVFVKEIEEALWDGQIDLAVHSLKDVPEELPQGLVIGAVLARENPMDALVTKSGCNFYHLPKGAKLGTGSLRRKTQLLQLRPDIEVVPIRGNIDSRLRKMDEGYEGIDGVVLAAAGLIRNGLTNRITHYFSLDEMIPACCQGTLAVELRENDFELIKIVSMIHHRNADFCQKAERSFLNGVGADCHAPAGALAVLEDGILNMTAMFYEDGLFTVKGQAPAQEAKILGQRLAVEILTQIEKKAGEKGL